MKQSTELNNLLSLIFQDDRIKIENGQLLIPSEIAKRFGDQIRRYKPEILLALGYCPVCASELITRKACIAGQRGKIKNGKHVYCQTPRHLDKWEF